MHGSQQSVQRKLTALPGWGRSVSAPAAREVPAGCIQDQPRGRAAAALGVSCVCGDGAGVAAWPGGKGTLLLHHRLLGISNSAVQDQLSCTPRSSLSPGHRSRTSREVPQAWVSSRCRRAALGTAGSGLGFQGNAALFATGGPGPGERSPAQRRPWRCLRLTRDSENGQPPGSQRCRLGPAARLGTLAGGSFGLLTPGTGRRSGASCALTIL